MFGRRRSQQDAQQNSQPVPSPRRNRINELPTLSNFSSPAVPISGWAAQDIMLGAGMVVIQPSTHGVVVVNSGNDWFLPRGRKDRGESLEATALREAHEETGYDVEFLPVYMHCHAPAPPNDPDSYHRPCVSEPVFVTTTCWGPRYRDGIVVRDAGEYIVHWYLGQIAEDAVPRSGTGMSNEQDYVAHILPPQRAYDLLRGSEKQVFLYAWEVYVQNLKIQEELAQEGQRGTDQPQGSTS